MTSSPAWLPRAYGPFWASAAGRQSTTEVEPKERPIGSTPPAGSPDVVGSTMSRLPSGARARSM
ncbi:hypothetical protein ACGFJ7_19400 [Actinoplanes sp. NPDC048988]|uniref:hypothetical protein n=1 Tax=Actinoplanes sp. NPDC048988 TaxID=3363901 RepID=UPI00371BCBC7